MGTAAPNSTHGTADPTALEIFQNQWDVYRKFLQHDYLSNRAACAVLRAYLLDELSRPFRILDLACGDASNIVEALSGMPVEGYRGVDLALPALQMAASNLASLSCPVELDECDFTTAIHDRAAPEDIVWISLSLHHLTAPNKLAFMRDVRAHLEPRGALLVYEPTRRDGEGRPEYLDRFEDIARSDWTGLSEREFTEALKHVRTCDLPETVSDWHCLGSEAGFSNTDELFRSSDDLFRLFRYAA
jgi:SAM-dependent methyltransferase